MLSTLFHTLYARIAVVLAVIFVVIGVFFIQVMVVFSERHQQEVTQRLNRDLATHIVEDRLLLKSQKINREALADVFDMMMTINPTLEIYLLDPKGKILAYSAPPGKVHKKQIDLDPIDKFLSEEKALPILGNDPRHPDDSKIFSVSPVKTNELLQGYLYIILASEQYVGVAEMLKSSYTMQLGTGVLIAGLLFVLFAALLLFFLLTRRLRNLSNAMESFKNSSHVPSFRYRHDDRGDEIDRLSASFNTMANRITDQIDKLRQTDALRRELVANVSHDLRTPLASLQGYLETLTLKQGELTNEEEQNYIEIATRHAVHLGQLVDDLFELAKLEANEIKPNLEPFAFQELVQDVIQKYELKAKQHGVQLIQSLEDDPPFVYGDVGLIERVLDNLLDNALRHTPRGGTVTVILTPHAETVSLEVVDSGCGIAPTDMPHIFERFYAPPEAGQKGTGLGLAIAKNIIELHGGVIRATSKLNKGTVFSFDLPTHHVTV
ncbi:sensor histidine kinase [Thiohalophilus thiocyanatoxydans]|uniref:histidine kinase n=1 Tax=Thiohalophilus thiocyanatoxydans TaxID=381308 RepID=A0A4R8IG67_9GAMM|nr:HAMP domain-containing sensor histidine kinase [Thiohalophilus thiocyanatoxydans]TDX99550.1 HAMP domain-containing protein [Thiohalophilus thiocyanatoxydans]